MSTPSERLEAEVWLDATDPDISVCQRDAFFQAVDDYYTANPTADRSPHFLATLREDNLAFTRVLNAILSSGAGDATGDIAQA